MREREASKITTTCELKTSVGWLCSRLLLRKWKTGGSVLRGRALGAAVAGAEAVVVTEAEWMKSSAFAQEFCVVLRLALLHTRIVLRLAVPDEPHM